MHLSRLLVGSFAISVCIAAQTPAPRGSQNSNPSTAGQKRTIRVGIAVMLNRSGRQANPTWERDQLVRELRRKRTDRKSSIVLDTVPLQASSKEDAGAEAAQKNCDYLVLTTMVDPRRGTGISEGPDGVAPAPVMIGNAQSGQTLAIDSAIIEVSDQRTIAQGTSTATVEENNETRAADEAMRMIAHRVVSELRKDRPPTID
jgi:hypothetical protein